MKYDKLITYDEGDTFHVAVKDAIKQRFREMKSIFAEIDLADNKEDKLVYAEQLPTSDPELIDPLLSKLFKKFPIDKLSFTDGFFLADELVAFSKKYQNEGHKYWCSSCSESFSINEGSMPEAMRDALQKLLQRFREGRM